MVSNTLDAYKKQFDEDLDGIHFLQIYYDPSTESTYKINTWHMRNMVDILRENNIQGEKIVEIGCGPLIMNSLLVSPYFKQLFPSDYSKTIRKPLQQWFNGEQLDGFDYTYMVNYIAKLHGVTGDELANLTRENFQQVLTVDIHLENIFIDGNISNLDAVITRFTIDSCSPDLQSYNQAMKNVTKALKRDGIFLQMGFFDHHADSFEKGFWDLGSNKFEDVRLTKQEIEQSLIQAGLELKAWKECLQDTTNEEAYNNTSIYALYAIKR